MAFINAAVLAMAFAPFGLAAPGPSKIQSRVAGGDLAEPGEFPFLVAPQLNGGQWCGATLLNAYTVLTAGHCSINIPAENLTVRAGSVVRDVLSQSKQEHEHEYGLTSWGVGLGNRWHCFKHFGNQDPPAIPTRERPI